MKFNASCHKYGILVVQTLIIKNILDFQTHLTKIGKHILAKTKMMTCKSVLTHLEHQREGRRHVHCSVGDLGDH